MKKKMPAAIILGLITLIAALALAVTNFFTEEPIRKRAQEAIRAACEDVIPAQEYEPVPIQGAEGILAIYAAKTEGAPVGYAVVAQKAGYAGPVEVTVGLDMQGTILGIRVGGVQFQETAGLGTRVREPAFTDQFSGKKPPVTLRGNVDVIAGVTVSSKAVTDAVNLAAQAAAPLAGFIIEDHPQVTAEETTTAEPEDFTGYLSGQAAGFQSDVKVRAEMQDGLIVSLQIDASGETMGFGTRLNDDEAFTAQFIGQRRPFTIGEGIDALSGATVSAQAAVKALNDATDAGSGLEFIAGTDDMEAFLSQDGALIIRPSSAELPFTVTASDGGLLVSVQKPVPESTATIEGLTAVSRKRGFESNVTATVTVDEEGRITDLVLRTSLETEYFGADVQSNAKFINQFIGLTGPFKAGTDGIDTVANATVTCLAVIEAINDCLLGLQEAQ